MTIWADVVQALGRASNPTEGRLFFAALLRAAADVPAEDMIVVGGSAIEFFTVGAYTTGDIDIVSRQAEALRTVLREWDFRREGRVWVEEEHGLVVDFVPHPYTGDEGRTHVLRTPYGSVRVAAPEDLLVKRLASARHWERPDDLEHAKLLASLQRDRLDWGYMRNLAAEYEVEDLLETLRRGLPSD